MNTNNIVIHSGDYSEILKQAHKKSFIYLDPPYHPISENSNFTGYIQGGWDIYDQSRLRLASDELNERGIKFLLSNTSADFIKDQYKNYRITTVKATRSINSDGTNRGEADEILKNAA